MERSSAIVAGDNPAAPPGMEPAGGNQAAPPWQADRRQSGTSRPWPNPKGTGTTDDATVPKQTGKKAKEKQDTKNTAKTVQKKPAGKTVAAKKVKVQKKQLGRQLRPRTSTSQTTWPNSLGRHIERRCNFHHVLSTMTFPNAGGESNQSVGAAGQSS